MPTGCRTNERTNKRTSERRNTASEERSEKRETANWLRKYESSSCVASLFRAHRNDNKTFYCVFRKREEETYFRRIFHSRERLLTRLVTRSLGSVGRSLLRQNIGRRTALRFATVEPRGGRIMAARAVRGKRGGRRRRVDGRGKRGSEQWAFDSIAPPALTRA